MNHQAVLSAEVFKSLKVLQDNIESKTQEIEQLKASINILANHIAVLENQNKGFLSKYKPFKKKRSFGRLKRKYAQKKTIF